METIIITEDYWIIKEGNKEIATIKQDHELETGLLRPSRRIAMGGKTLEYSLKTIKQFNQKHTNNKV